MTFFAAFANLVVRWNFAEMAEVIGAPLPVTNQSAPTEAIWTEEARAASSGLTLRTWRYGKTGKKITFSLRLWES